LAELKLQKDGWLTVDRYAPQPDLRGLRVLFHGV
jgi:hypothetical protein